jgi:hypothetical protein
VTGPGRRRFVLVGLGLGLVAAALGAYLVISSDDDNGPRRRGGVPAETVTVRVGRRVTVDSGDIRTIRLITLKRPVPAPKTFPAQEDKEFAVAQVEVCAGGEGSPAGPTESFFDLVFSDDTVAGPLPLRARTPALEDIQSLDPKQCRRGYLTFLTDKQKTPVLIRYLPDPSFIYRWRL